MYTVEIEAEGLVSAYLQEILGCYDFHGEIELGIYNEGVLVGAAVLDNIGGGEAYLNVGGAGFSDPTVLAAIAMFVYDYMEIETLVGLVGPTNPLGRTFAAGFGAVNTGPEADVLEDMDRWTMTKEQCVYYI